MQINYKIGVKRQNGRNLPGENGEWGGIGAGPKDEKDLKRQGRPFNQNKSWGTWESEMWEWAAAANEETE